MTRSAGLASSIYQDWVETRLHIPAPLGYRFVLVRPDGHVAWRGDQLPDDPGAVLDIVRGAAVGASRLAATEPAVARDPICG